MRKALCRLRTAVVFFIIHATIFPLLVYQEHYITSVGLDAYSWSVNSWTKLQPSANHYFNLPSKYRRTDSNTTIVLFWKPAFENVAVLADKLDENCFQTYDQSAADIADAIVFHFRETSDNPSSLPIRSRKQEQIWVWYSQEPPSHTLHQFKKKLTPLGGLFNWTMSYRFDSDIFAPYKMPYSAYKMDSGRLDKLLKLKANSAAIGIALISNCASTLRLDVLNELSKYIDIDIFGKCTGKHLCREEQCQKDAISRYKFFFAFENSLCRNYISEKLWQNGFLSNAVPVVMGAAKEDYELLAPNHSYIHVDDFSSLKELAQYLDKLHQNDKLYVEYFKWRFNPEKENQEYFQRVMNQENHKTKGLRDSISYDKNPFQILCKKLQNRNNNKNQVIDHLDEWWYGNKYTSNNNDISAICSDQDRNSNNAIIWISKFYIVFFCLTLVLFFFHEKKRFRLPPPCV